jgi:hypothetical protein
LFLGCFTHPIYPNNEALETSMIRFKDRPFLFLILPALLLVSLTLLGILQVSAGTENPVPPAAPPAQVMSNQECLGCHANPGQQITLPSGEILYISIDAETYNSSVHGSRGYACVQCHTDTPTFPHPPLTAQTRREYSLQKAQICQSCHQVQAQETMNSAHQLALAAGDQNAAVCTDCHGAHGVMPLDEPRSRIPQTCERCHSEIFALYKDSVHGEALLGEGNPDVPSCVDCHGALDPQTEEVNSHDIHGPSTSGFRLFSPDICARCHADQELMAKYGINTDVFETYISDFHGTTVEMFQANAPGQETNKPVCIDCHGVHTMKRVDDPESQVIKTKLLDTCQRCHPGATANFSDAWLSHYRPSPQHNPIVYYVNTFYKIFIPGVLGIMGVFVLSDIYRRFRGRGK